MDRLNKVFFIFMAVVGASTLALQFPAILEQRGVTNDAQTVSDLQAIESAISSYTLDKGDLPDSLGDITLEGDVKARSSRYEYKPAANGAYELCTTFKTDKSKGGQGVSSDLYYAYNFHAKGHQCFTEYDTYVGYDNYLKDYSLSPNDSSNATEGTNTNTGLANDLEIQIDLTSLQAHLETYFATSGYYPGKASLQNAAWRAANMPYLDEQTIQGPNGETLGSGYTYTPQPANCETNCSSYTLSATTSGGAAYTKKSY